MMTFGWGGEVNTQNVQKNKSEFVRDKEDSTLNKEARLNKLFSGYGEGRKDIKVDVRYGGQIGYCPDDYKIS